MAHLPKLKCQSIHFCPLNLTFKYEFLVFPLVIQRSVKDLWCATDVTLWHTRPICIKFVSSTLDCQGICEAVVILNTHCELIKLYEHLTFAITSPNVDLFSELFPCRPSIKDSTLNASPHCLVICHIKSKCVLGWR